MKQTKKLQYRDPARLTAKYPVREIIMAGSSCALLGLVGGSWLNYFYGVTL